MGTREKIDAINAEIKRLKRIDQVKVWIRLYNPLQRRNAWTLKWVDKKAIN